MRDAAAGGCRAHGIDFAPHMIAHANAYRSELASFACEDMFAFDAPSGAYDIVSTMGVIAYISFEQLQVPTVRPVFQ